MSDGTATAPGGSDSSIVRPVPKGVVAGLSAIEAALLAELDTLGRTVARAKQEIARLRVEDITGSHIPNATDELDAIVDHTAQATNEILDCCEVLEGVSGRIGAPEAAVLAGAITRICVACSFQDITGQRIGKVVSALKAIEARVAAVTGSFRAAEAAADAVPSPSEGWRLAAGPQLPGAGVSQADIDRMLADP